MFTLDNAVWRVSSTYMSLKLLLQLQFKVQQLLDPFQDLQTHVLELLVLSDVSEVNIFLFKCRLSI